MVASTKKMSSLMLMVSAIFFWSNNALSASGSESVASEKDNERSYESIPKRFPCEPGYRCKIVISPTQPDGDGNGGEGMQGPGSEATGRGAIRELIRSDRQNHQMGR